MKKRLDLYLAEQTKLPRHQVQKLIKNEGVKVNGRMIFKPAFEVEAGAKVEYLLPVAKSGAPGPEAIPLELLYEDEVVVVVNKPAGLVTHPGAGNPDHTLVNGLLARYKTLPVADDPMKPGIVHRLDKGTSGCLVVARTGESLADLQRQFKQRTVEKIYRALVVGSVAETGRIEKPIGRHPTRRQKISSRTRKGREAITEWRVLERFGEKYTWVEIRLHTGRTHQIRVHFAESGHPLVGDLTYGRHDKVFLKSMDRPALHAFRLSFDHPVTKERLTFEAPLPDDLRRVLAFLK